MRETRKVAAAMNNYYFMQSASPRLGCHRPKNHTWQNCVSRLIEAQRKSENGVPRLMCPIRKRFRPVLCMMNTQCMITTHTVRDELLCLMLRLAVYRMTDYGLPDHQSSLQVYTAYTFFIDLV